MVRKQEDVPEEISKMGQEGWYSGLSDQDKVRLGRYVGGSDTSSWSGFCLSVSRRAVSEENYPVSIIVGESALGGDVTGIERFEMLEEIIPAYFGMGRYDDCMRCCEEGLALIPGVMEGLRARNGGSLPERVQCRNYTVNVLIGARGDYEAADRALDRFLEMGLISEEDVAYRKQSHKVHRLQRAFDGIFSSTVSGR
ncbi:MAG: hypothetical protein FWH47_02290 [Methanomassiliicoccaceae archaeon]|nr:hypothetical protein [Methanomassiliicoccaceae archaeon]